MATHGKSFAAGKKYQTSICEKINKLQLNGVKCIPIEVEGAKAGADINLISHSNVGIETKNNGAFEGGAVKMIYNDIEKRLTIKEPNIHQTILGNTKIYDGMNLPWYEGKKTAEDWNKVKAIFEKDIYIQASNTAISEYYQNNGVTYIQIENKGMYHTGKDPLMLNVPYFSCEIKLRIRSTKHKKNGICTDVTAALQYNRRQLVKSPFGLDDNSILPAPMQRVVE